MPVTDGVVPKPASFENKLLLKPVSIVFSIIPIPTVERP